MDIKSPWRGRSVPAFQPGGLGSIRGEIRNFNLNPGTGWASFVCVLYCVVSGGGPDVLLATDFREARSYVSV